MNKLYKSLPSLVAGVLLLSMSSCNFLNVDKYFEDTFKEDSIFHSKVNAEGYLWATPTQFPDPGAIWGGSWNPGQLASDEMVCKWQTHEFWGAQFTVGNIDSRNLPNAYLWKNMYSIIARCNTMLKNVDKVKDMNVLDRQVYKSYVYFMRGYAYYHLLMNWGPILYIDETDDLPTSAPASTFDRERMTYDASVDSICADFERAALYMKDKQQNGFAFYERPPLGAAYALIARLRLFQASPLFNGGDAARKAFGNWTRESDGKHYVNQEYDPSRWAVAAAAAKRVIDLGIYSLHTVPIDPKLPYELASNVPTEKFPNGAGGIDPYHSFSDMFTGVTPIQVNPEFIWALPSSNVHGYTKHCFPVGAGGWGGLSVPQRVVNSFLMNDGRTFEEAAATDPSLTDLTQTMDPKATGLSDYTIQNGVPKMYSNRSARFYASIGYPGRYWPMYSDVKTSQSNRVYWYSKDDQVAGLAGAGNNVNDYCISGYVPTKYINFDDSWFFVKDNKSGAFVSSPKPFPIIRYAEVLLEYIEALNNVEEPTVVQLANRSGQMTDYPISRDIEEMSKYFNMIRYRVGLPGPDKTVLADADAMRKVIMNERQVELFNEGYRYFDTRRWGIYEEIDAESSNYQGLDVHKDRTDANGNGGFWNIVTINEQNIRDRIAKSKMYLLPLPHNELEKVPAMAQNPGWDR